jgi:hypothetical protein
MNTVLTTKPIRLELPGSAGICAFDRDECTATIAFETEAELQAVINRLPGRKRVRIIEDQGGES